MAGDPPTASALCSDAGLATPELTVLLHFGQRTLNGREGDFSSSTCRRVAHFGQTRIMIVFRQAGYSIRPSIEPESENVLTGMVSPSRRMKSSAAVMPLSESRRLF